MSRGIIPSRKKLAGRKWERGPLLRVRRAESTFLLPRVEVDVVSAEHFNREGGKLNAISATVQPPDLQAGAPGSPAP